MHKSQRYAYKIKLDYINVNQQFNGMTEIHLNTQAMDATEIREYIIYELYNKLGIKTQQYCFGNFFINDRDMGLVTVVEIINEEYINKKYNSEKGILYKPVTMHYKEIYGADLLYRGDNIEEYKGIFDNVKSENITFEDKKRLVNIIKRIDEAKTTEELEKYFYDLDKIIKDVAITKAVSNNL